MIFISRKKNHEKELEERLYKYGYRILNYADYINEKEYTYFVDNDFYIYRTTLKEIRKLVKPNLVHVKNIYTNYNIHLYMYYNFPNINVLWITRDENIKKYILKCYCKIDNNTWEGYLTNFMNKNMITGCSKCKKRKEAEKIFSTNPKLNSFLRDSISSWRIRTIKNNNYKCVITGDKFDDVHHIYSFNKITAEAMLELDIDILKDVNEYTISDLERMKENFSKIHDRYGLGVCLTKDMHKAFHSIYGYNNNIEQWENFTRLFNIK